MADVIEFGRKAEHLKAERDLALRKRKIEALRKTLQCSRCLIRCAKCGAQLGPEERYHNRYAAPYVFCTNCQEEYEEYRALKEGKLKQPRYYWHNEAWMKVWESWLEHQKCLEGYRQSKEFLKLMEEVEKLLGK